MLFRAAWIKRNDPWPCSFKHQPRVISVLSYYLTSLVNLSFCRFDPASRSAQFSNRVYCCILLWWDGLMLGVASFAAVIVWLYLAKSWQFCLHLSVLFGISHSNTCFCFLPLLSYAIYSFIVCNLLLHVLWFDYLHSTTLSLIASAYCMAYSFLLWAGKLYLYIGITSCVYKISQNICFCNMENYTK